MALRNIHSGDVENDNFNDLLNKFDTAGEDKKKLSTLIEETKTRPITFRQREAVIARCVNVLNGSFGKTKKESNFGHTKIS